VLLLFRAQQLIFSSPNQENSFKQRELPLCSWYTHKLYQTFSLCFCIYTVTTLNFPMRLTILRS